MIILFTDYGRNGPYTGQLEARLYQCCPAAVVIDLLSDVPSYDIRHAGYLLNAFQPQFPPGSVFLAVVDPGVGGMRDPVVVLADGRYYVGPMNGLFDVVITMSKDVEVHRIDSSAFDSSYTFHGRDIFAPVAAMLDCNEEVSYSEKLSISVISNNPHPDLFEIIYIDDFGNCFTGIHGATLSQTSQLQVGSKTLRFAKTFSDCQKGECFWYVNSIGLVEIAANQADVSTILHLEIGHVVKVIENNG